MKVAVIGGGGFRTPHVWEALASGPEEIDELALQDVSEPRLAVIEAVLRGLRDERGGGPLVSTTTSLEEAVEGAGAVFCAIRVGGLAGRVVDETVPLREGVLGQETVGPGGICFALRTVPVMLHIARTVARRAPMAWFLNFTNPAGLVTEAVAAVLGDRAIGICDSPTALCARVAAALGRRVNELCFDYAGLNHLGWLLAARDGVHDELPELLADDERLGRVEEAGLFGRDRLRALAMIPNEYLVYYEASARIVTALRRAQATRGEVVARQQTRFYEGAPGTPAEALAAWRAARDARYGTYMAEAWGASSRAGPPPGSVMEDSDEGSGEAGYAVIAASFLGGVSGRASGTLIIDVRNRGRLAFLDDDAVVEVPCKLSPHGADTVPVAGLPSPQADLVARVKEVERTTIRAAVEGSRALALEAVAAHPVVPTRAAAERILEGYLAALPELARRLS
jgi:6-phospho-beta-glucosidase